MQLSKEFKIRCSAIGQIMTEPKLKSEKLSKTCIAYVHDWIKSQPEFYNREKQFHSKYTLKGTEVEHESIEFVNSILGTSYKKNEQEFENDFLTGTPDIITDTEVNDIKNSWDQNSFPLFEKEIPIKGYDWQMQGYMCLIPRPNAKLIYTLMDAPERIIDKEARYKAYELGMEEVEYNIYEEVKQNLTFSDVKQCLRIKIFPITYDADKIIKVQDRVQQIRDYITSL